MKWPATAIRHGLPRLAWNGKGRTKRSNGWAGQVKSRVDGGRRKCSQMARLQVCPSRTRPGLHPLCTISRPRAAVASCWKGRQADQRPSTAMARAVGASATRPALSVGVGVGPGDVCDRLKSRSARGPDMSAGNPGHRLITLSPMWFGRRVMAAVQSAESLSLKSSSIMPFLRAAAVPSRFFRGGRPNLVRGPPHWRLGGPGGGRAAR